MTESGSVRLEINFLVPEFDCCEHLQNRSNKSVLPLSSGYSKVILNKLEGEQEIVVRSSVMSRNHLEEMSTKFKACTDNSTDVTDS